MRFRFAALPLRTADFPAFHLAQHSTVQAYPACAAERVDAVGGQRKRWRYRAFYHHTLSLPRGCVATAGSALVRGGSAGAGPHALFAPAAGRFSG